MPVTMDGICKGTGGMWPVFVFADCCHYDSTTFGGGRACAGTRNKHYSMGLLYCCQLPCKPHIPADSCDMSIEPLVCWQGKFFKILASWQLRGSFAKAVYRRLFARLGLTVPLTGGTDGRRPRSTMDMLIPMLWHCL